MLAALVALTAAVGCGVADTATLSSRPTPAPADADVASAAHWQATTLPLGFEPVLVEERDNGWTIFYAGPQSRGDLYDAPLRVSGTVEERLGATRRPDVRKQRVAGHDAAVVSLFDDGAVFGSGVTWQQQSGQWISVEAMVPPLEERDALSVAEGLAPVQDDNWDRLKRGLAIDSLVGRSDPAATPVLVIQGGLGYELFAHVPPGYPLSSNDRRRACYSLVYRRDSSPILCDTHPWWLRVGGQVFVFGPADADAPDLWINPSQGQPGIPIRTKTARVPGGPPVSFYAQPLADGACWLEIRRVDGNAGGSLGPTGPLPANAEHAACLASLGLDQRFPVAPSTTAH